MTGCIHLEMAKQCQKQRLAEKALQAYVAAFAAKTGNAEDYLEAAFIAFLAQDPGFYDEFGPFEVLFDDSWPLAFSLLEQGMQEYPQTKRVYEFWHQFFNLILLAEDKVDYQTFIDNGIVDAYFYRMEVEPFDLAELKKLILSLQRADTFRSRYLLALLGRRIESFQ